MSLPSQNPHVQHTTQNTLTNALQVLVSSALYASYTVVMRKRLPDEHEVHGWGGGGVAPC